MAIGQRLQQARLQRAMTQEELSQLSGVTEASISRIENGLVIRPRMMTARALAAALGVDPGWLLTGLEPVGKSDNGGVGDRPGGEDSAS